jgi:hypothetical protein
MISSIIAAKPGTSSSINPGGSCQSDYDNGRTGFNQWDSVLGMSGRRLPIAGTAREKVRQTHGGLARLSRSVMVDRPPCPKCGSVMWMVRIQPVEPRVDKRTFECPMRNFRNGGSEIQVSVLCSVLTTNMVGPQFTPCGHLIARRV